MSTFLTFEASLECWDILFNPLEVVADLHFFGYMGLIKSQDVGVDLYLPTTLSDWDSFDICHALFSPVCCHFFCCSQCQLPTSDNSFRRVQSLLGICLTFVSVEAFYLEDVFGLPPVVHFSKQVSVSSFLYVFWGVALDATNFYIKKGENLARQTFSKDQ